MKWAMAGPRFSGSILEEIRIVFRLVPVHAALPVCAGGSATGLSATGARMSLPVIIEPCASKMKSARAKIDNPAPNKKFWKAGALCVEPRKGAAESRCLTLLFVLGKRLLRLAASKRVGRRVVFENFTAMRGHLPHLLDMPGVLLLQVAETKNAK